MKFRIVEVTKGDKIFFVVEKQKYFLWFVWWDTVLIFKGDSWYYSDQYAIYKTLEEAESFIREQDIKIKILKEVVI